MALLGRGALAWWALLLAAVRLALLVTGSGAGMATMAAATLLPLEWQLEWPIGMAPMECSTSKQLPSLVRNISGKQRHGSTG